MGELNFGRILRRARMFADQPAVTDLGNGHTATHAEHLVRIGRLCSVLADCGVGPTDHLGVMAGGSHAYVELWRACLAGAAVINPLNTRLAPDELVYILDDSATEVIFVDATYAPMIAGLRERCPRLRLVVLIGDDPGGTAPHDAVLEDLIAAATDAGLPPEPDDDAAAVLMYTGGTTGLPKGVVLSQRAIALVIYRMQLGAGYRPTQTYLAFMPMFHIGGIASWGLFLPTGGHTVIVPAFEPGMVNRAISDHGVTSIGAVPTMLAMMLAHPEFEPAMLRTLQNIMYGAAPMPPELLDKLMAMAPDLSFFQAYGMTECAATVTGLTPEDHRRGGDILRSVGRPCIGVDIEIRDPETTDPLPQGEVGEVWLRCGSALTEYWNKPEQTAAALVDSWYRTGDAGRLDPEGYLFLADRVKDMIVTGGENVYSLEVENAISTHPAVVQVAVVGVAHETWGEAVHAVVVCAPGAVTAEDLEAHARTTIAGYKIPKSWTFRTDPLPLSAAGKVLKRDLRAELAP
jgi:long-chain acyl-CoA synthetase